VSLILRGIADEIAKPNIKFVEAIRNARELIRWLPDDVVTARGRQDRASETVAHLPLLDFGAKLELLTQTLAKPGRPPQSRGVAALALEMHAAGKSWSKIENELLPNRRNVAKPGENIRREVQHLKIILKKHGIAVIYPSY
jgi:hypothetical protein